MLFISILYGITIGIALSLDAFMLSLVYGATFKRRQETILTSLLVGLFHFFMPLIGFIICRFILIKINIVDHVQQQTNYIAFVVLLLLGVMMIWKKESHNSHSITTLISKILFAFTVSIDSLITGVALVSIRSIHIVIVGTLFALISFSFTCMGLSIGKKAAEKYSLLKLDFYAGILMIFIAFITLFLS